MCRPLLIIVPVGVVLVWITIDDLRRFKIRNVWIMFLAVGFLIKCGADQRADVLLAHGLFATLGLAALACLFAFGLMGGGDAKLLGAALLWVGPEGCLVYALLLLPCATIYVLGARFAGWPARRRAGGLEIPFGPSIAMAWLAFLAIAAWL